MSNITDARSWDSSPNKTQDNECNTTAVFRLTTVTEKSLALGLNESLLIGVQQSLEQYVIPALCAFGIFGNLLSLVIISRTKFRKTDGSGESGAHLGLVFLAISDSLFCASLFPKAFISTTDSVFTHFGFKLIYQVYCTGVITTFLLTSTWITVAMAFLRYLNICHPFRSRRHDGLKCAKLVYPSICMLCILLNIPSFLQYQVTDYKTFYLVDLGPMAYVYTRGKVVCWIRACFGIFIPACILIFCNFSLIRALKHSQRLRLNSYVKETPAQRSRKWITITLIIIALSFIVLVFPSELIEFFHHAIQNDVGRTETVMLIRAVTNTLQVFNFTLNFILYFVINIHFRKSVRELCDCSGAMTAIRNLRGSQGSQCSQSTILPRRTTMIRRISTWKASSLTVL
ncbi:hypothetical protein CAPTEDRAFT_190026 [Capitella teleta]|uniref:G-protein coupled receptors family 1 profile domain-containing protein n=1 Tax=Capitella teleta TaxID=283909 RepID=R7V623_CAPTE|nr:hypothetical protein CAPTEDRAFT_190026 [Capitella teleta]|eukprot:ELU11791.1 hypothetical protein CAPTEDRAFT_190026 [Capitella teleta]